MGVGPSRSGTVDTKLRVDVKKRCRRMGGLASAQKLRSNLCDKTVSIRSRPARRLKHTEMLLVLGMSVCGSVPVLACLGSRVCTLLVSSTQPRLTLGLIHGGMTHLQVSGPNRDGAAAAMWPQPIMYPSKGFEKKKTAKFQRLYKRADHVFESPSDSQTRP